MAEQGMTLDEYQAETRRTAAGGDMVVFALGLIGESGEVADLVKKVIGHGHPMEVDKLEKELGDVLWYIAAMADSIGLSLEQVARANVEKLRKRYPDGFSSERSRNRSEG